MTNPWTWRAVSDQLSRTAGGYLRNTIREPYVTCSVCTKPADGFLRCFRCNEHVQQADGALADRVGFLTYAVQGEQSGYVMHGYKAASPVHVHRVVVTLLVAVGVGLHTRCAGTLEGRPVSHWATVPSLAGREGEHPLHRIVALFPQSAEVPVHAVATTDPRKLDAGHFQIPQRLPDGSHVLVIDDTWTGGGHAQSVVLALRGAGAASVSLLLVDRWLQPRFGNTWEFIRTRLRSDFNPDLCPWTGGSCP